jgi:hypothetical protein
VAQQGRSGPDPFFARGRESHGAPLNAFIRADFKLGQPRKIDGVVFLRQKY